MGGNLAAMPKVLILIMNKETEKKWIWFFIYTKLYADWCGIRRFFLSSSIVFGYIFSFLDFFFRGGGGSLVNVRQNRNEVFAKGFLVTKNYVMELINKKSVGRQDEY